MLTPRELATMRAALLFWQEEMCPHDEAMMRPYLEPPDMRPLSAAEVDILRAVLVPANVRYARYEPNAQQLQSTELFSSIDEASGAAGSAMAVVTVLVRTA